MQEPIRLSCPAKINLTLSVGDVSKDANDPRHPLASWMVAIRFADELTLRAIEGRSVFSFDVDPDFAELIQVDWPLESDLAYRAHQLLESAAGRPLPVSAQLTKRVPAGAGLGGGSGDAAAMLVGLNKLFSLELSRDELAALSERLGSDVTFAVHAMTGSPSAIVTGFGEYIDAVTVDRRLHLVLVLPKLHCDTGKVYAAFDQAQSDDAQSFRHPDEARVRDLIALDPLPPDSLFNDLAAPAMHVQPQLGAHHDELREVMQLSVHVTGSGAAMFLIAPSDITAKALARKVTALTGLTAIATRTL